MTSSWRIAFALGAVIASIASTVFSSDEYPTKVTVGNESALRVTGSHGSRRSSDVDHGIPLILLSLKARGRGPLLRRNGKVPHLSF